MCYTTVTSYVTEGKVMCMRKTWISLLSMSLMLVLLCSAALASAPHPGMSGDVGGQYASQISDGLQGNYTSSGYDGVTGSSSGFQSSLFTQGGKLPDDVDRNNIFKMTYPGSEDLSGASSESSGFGSWGDQVTAGEEADVVGYADGETPPVVADETTQQTNNTVSDVTLPSGTTKTLDWFGAQGQALLTANPSLTIYDVTSGVTWSAKYINGKNHADIIPASAVEASKLTTANIIGSYVRRPVIVSVNGEKYAGSMYAVGHGETSYCDYFKGVMCIHFTGSMTHGSAKVDDDHQSAIQSALTSGY